MSKKKVAIILAGNGVYDGSEIHEATMTMYAIVKNGGSYEIFAPNINQHHVINHLTGEEMDEKRNVLIESARIARGKAIDIKELDPSNFDALIIPGGFGVAKNLSNFAFVGTEMTILKDLENIILKFVEQSKPIGALCISPAIITKVLEEPTLTIGSDNDTIIALEAMGAKHIITDHGEVVIDEKYKLATTPCYMLDATIAEIGDGAQNIVKAIFEMI